MTDNSETDLAACPNPWGCSRSQAPVCTPYNFDGSSSLHHVVCHSCGLRGPVHTTETKAIAAWNTRQSNPAQGWRELLQEARGHLNRLVLAVTEFGPHSGFWDWMEDAKPSLAKIDAFLSTEPTNEGENEAPAELVHDLTRKPTAVEQDLLDQIEVLRKDCAQWNENNFVLQEKLDAALSKPQAKDAG